MEYREEFETRKDVFRVNVFHNKKNGEKVTMYFVPRTTPVNDDTVFDYCTKNKTWREKQAQQWCDEKSGKNKDKLKSLPFVAGGLQRDVVAGTQSPVWKGDNILEAFNDYKRGLGMTIQPKTNNQSNGNQVFQEKAKALISLGEKVIVQKFNELFKVGSDNWRTYDAGHNAYGEALMNAELSIKGKDGQLKIFKTKTGSGVEPAVGKRSAQRNVILAFLAEEYGIGEKKEKKQADLEGFKDYIRENLRNTNCRLVVLEIAKRFGLKASYENYDPRAKIGKYQGNAISLHIGDGESFPHTYRGLGQSRNDAENTAALKMAKELCGIDVEKAILDENVSEETLKYLRVLNDREDTQFDVDRMAGYTEYNFRVNTGEYSMLMFDSTNHYHIQMNDYDITPRVLEKVVVSKEERERINKEIDKDIKERFAELRRKEQERIAAEKRVAEQEAEQARLAEEKRIQENGGLNAKLEEAVKADDLDEVKSLIAAGAQTSNKSVYDNTLNIALKAESINQDMVNFLMDNGAQTEFPVYHSFDGDLVTTKSLLCEKITNLDVKAVKALVIGGADVWFDADMPIHGEKPYDSGVSIWDALEEVEKKKNSCEEYGEDDTEEYNDAVEILKIIEDAREGRIEIHEADKTAQQTQEVSEAQDAVSATKTNPEIEDNVAKGAALVSSAKEEEEHVGTPLPIISDDKGMIHLAPRENLKQSAILSMSLFDDKGAEIPIKVALVSDRVHLQSNTKLSQEDMLDHADVIDKSAFLVSYSKAKEIIGEMEKHGKTADASQARIRINLFKNMGEKSPIEKPYDGNIFTQFIARGGKGLGE